MRIDVHRHAHAAAFGRGLGDHGAQKPLQIGAARRLDEKAEAVAAAHHGNGRLGRSKHHHLVSAGQGADGGDPPALARRHVEGGAGQRAHMGLGARPVVAGDDDGGEPAEGRKAGAFARGDLLGVEPLRIARQQGAHHRVIGLPGLHQSAPGALASPGAAGHLLEQLERALGGARIAGGEAHIGIDDPDEGQLRKVVSLGDKLGADDDVEGPVGDVLELAPQPFGAAGKI